MKQDNITIILFDIREEYLKASEKFPPFHSGHEGYAVIYEEMDELWEEVKKYPNYDNVALRKEAIQVGAMVLRFIIDLCMNSRLSKTK